MITSWVLVFFMTYDRSASMATIQSLASVQECNRVAEVIKRQFSRTFDGRRYVEHKCVEVIHTKPQEPK